MHGGDGTKLALGQTQLNTQYIGQGLNGTVEKVIEKSPALAKDAAQELGHGEDDLAVRHGVADALLFARSLTSTELDKRHASDQGVAGLDGWKAAEVTVHAPKFSHTVALATGHDSRIVDHRS